jgi:hypothetical protein
LTFKILLILFNPSPIFREELYYRFEVFVFVDLETDTRVDRTSAGDDSSSRIDLENRENHESVYFEKHAELFRDQYPILGQLLKVQTL